MEKVNIKQVFGLSPATESSEPEFLSEAHQAFLLEFVAEREAAEQAAIDAFLADR